MRDPSKGNDKDLGGSRPIPEVEAVLKKLAQWRACRPIQPQGVPTLPLLSKEQLEMDYHEVGRLEQDEVQMLSLCSVSRCCSGLSLRAARLQPTMRLCAPSPLRVAARYVNRFIVTTSHRDADPQTDMFGPNSPSLRLVTWQLYRLFLSGLTLLHLVSSPTTQTSINHDRAAQALYNSQQTVAQLVELFPGASPYQHVFSDLVRGWESRRHEQMARMPAPQPQSARPELLRSNSGSNGGFGMNKSPDTSSSGLPSPFMSNTGESNLSWRQTMMTGQPTPAPLDSNWMAQLTTDMLAQAAVPDNQATLLGSQGSAGSVPAPNQGQHPSGQQTLAEGMGDSWTPLFGSPRGTEAFSDQWGGTLNQMGGQLAGPMRDDFFSYVSQHPPPTSISCLCPVSRMVQSSASLDGYA